MQSQECNWKLPYFESEHLRGPVAILFISRDTCSDSIAKLFSESVSTGVWCVPGFGAGFEIALEPSKLQKQPENPGKGRFYFLRQILVCTKPWFKRDLIFRACFCGGGGIAQLSRDMLQNGVLHRCAGVKLSTKGGYRTILGEC